MHAGPGGSSKGLRARWERDRPSRTNRRLTDWTHIEPLLDEARHALEGRIKFGESNHFRKKTPV